jgi:hypothetical protein
VLGTDINAHLGPGGWFEPTLKFRSEEILFSAERPVATGSVAWTKENFRKRTGGILAQNFSPCGKLREQFFANSWIQTAEKIVCQVPE